MPSIETNLKEAFNISRFRLLNPILNADIKGKKERFTSEYFKVDFVNNHIDVKLKYQINSYFQENIAKQLKRGIYKMFLEEKE